MPRRVQSLITIHGVNSDGEWQERLADRFAPFFNCVPLRYKQFRYFGFFKQLFGFFVPIGFLCALAVVYWSIPMFTAFLIVGSVFLVLILLRLEPRLLRNAAISTVRDECAKQASMDGVRHIIAHSFGTYVAARLLERDTASLSFDKVILVSSIVREDHDWSSILRQNGTAFRSVRNEIGCFDPVPGYIERAARWGWVPFGMSGKNGFQGPHELVHWLDGPLESCGSCRANGHSSPVVHNVEYSLAHSDFLNDAHFLWLWLPVLSGLDPAEFRRFNDLCMQGLMAQEQSDHDQLIEVEARMKDSEWTWARGPLRDHLERRVVGFFAGRSMRSPARRLVNVLVDSSIPLIWRAFKDALEEYRKPGARRGNVVFGLLPTYAVGRAVEAVGKHHLQNSGPVR